MSGVAIGTILQVDPRMRVNQTKNACRTYGQSIACGKHRTYGGSRPWWVDPHACGVNSQMSACGWGRGSICMQGKLKVGAIFVPLRVDPRMRVNS